MALECLYIDEEGNCQATGKPCKPLPECFEAVPEGNDTIESRGELEESFDKMFGYPNKGSVIVDGK